MDQLAGAKDVQMVCCDDAQVHTGPAVCRFRGAKSTSVDAPADYDAEARALTCKVSKDAVHDFTQYEVVTADGQLLCSREGGGDKCMAADRDAMPAATTKGLFQHLSFLDRWLAVWILLTMAAGLLLGKFVPSVRSAWNTSEIASVSLPIAIGLWLMMWPVLSKVQYELLGKIFKVRGFSRLLITSFVTNWLVGPALMTGLAWATLFDLPPYRTGVIMVGLARCIAMVIIWSDLARGDPELCAILVACNSMLQIVLYAPLSLFYLQVVSRGAGTGVTFWPVAKSVLLFLGVPLVAGVITRYALIATAGRRWFEQRFLPYFGPLALLGLLWTIFVMFSSQAQAILDDIVGVVRVGAPMLLYFGIMFFGTLYVSRRQGVSYTQAVTQAFTAAGNNFELAIAIAVATFGIQSKESLAATIGPLIEVPALLALVYVSLWLKQKWWSGEQGASLASMGAFGTQRGPRAGCDAALGCGNKYGCAPAAGTST